MNWIKEIENYVPFNAQEESDKKIILDAIRNHSNILTETMK